MSRKYYSSFQNSRHSHEHSLETLNLLYEYDDFMESIGRLADLGCGSKGKDLEWWATRTTRDETQTPLGIRCVGMDICDGLEYKHKNVAFQKCNIESINEPTKKFDLLWCHDTFQYLLNPYKALANWKSIANQDAMLILMIPQNTNVEYHRQNFDFPLGHFYNYTLSSLIYMLAVNGWDCNGGFFKKDPGNKWISAIVYNSEIQPMDPMETDWYDLLETGLLPETAVQSITKYGYVCQTELILPWLDKSLSWMAQQ